MLKLDDAIVFAADAHRGQMRIIPGEPYITHPLRVLSILVRHGVTDEEMLVAAVLHDVVEDTPVTLDGIRRKFGGRVSDLVAALTKPADRERPDRHEAVLEQLRALPEAGVIKMADRLDNLSELQLTDWTGDRKRLYAEQGLEFIEIAEEGNPALAASLRSVCMEVLAGRS
jgi:(p)ppGpp synthase/HD superfamily hydrolase